MTINEYKDAYAKCETIRNKLYEVHDIMLGLAVQGVLNSKDFDEFGAMIRKLDEIDQRVYDACEDAHPHFADFHVGQIGARVNDGRFGSRGNEEG